jgi:hypothetical protein
MKQGDYQINFATDREKARSFLARLATESQLREELKSEPERVLFDEVGITIDRERLPDEIKLPAEKEIEHLLYAADSAVETASPFGLLVLFVVFGAMPMTAPRSPTRDGAG